MKISRRDLRKIILENILSEQENRTGGGATRVRSDNREELLTKIENIIKDAAADNSGLVEAIIKVGKDFITFSGLIVKEGASKGEVKRAIRDAINKAEEIDDLRAQLRRGRAYKVIINRSGEVQATETEEPTEPAGPDESPSETDCDATLKEKTKTLDLFGSTDPTNHTSSNRKFNPTVAYGFQYPGDNTYRYYVSTVDGCWYALNTETCKLFSMKKYPSNMKNLDKEFPNARDQGLIDKCAGSTSSTSSTPNTPNTPTAPSPKPGVNLTLREQALIMLMAAGVNNRSSYRGADLAILFETGTTDAYKEVIAQVKRQTSIKSLIMAVGKFHATKEERGLLDISNVTGNFDYNQQRSRLKAGAALKLALNKGAAFDLPGGDAAPFYVDHMRELKDALGKYLNAPGGTLNESAYGKSRGTLLRERYWGRY